MDKQIRVQKADGTLEPFDEMKVRSSLKRAGADPVTINEVMAQVKDELYDGIPTEKIYQKVFRILNTKPEDTGHRYSLKRAIMDLGPTGYPFELFVSGVLKHYGYKTDPNMIARGKCVSHEIDVVAEKDGKKVMVECKFHNHPGTKSGIKTALYTWARFLDVREKNGFDEAWLATNTKVTSEAVDYANCMGIKIISWNYPQDFSLRFLVEKADLHPVTERTDISRSEKEKLLKEGVIFMRDWKHK